MCFAVASPLMSHSQIRSTKATMKRYRHGSTEANAEKKYAASEKRLATLQAKLDKVDLKHGVRVSQHCVGAFVVFNCEDSKRFCLEDYHGSGSWWKQATQVGQCTARVYV
jgi:hypothetical protein